MKLRVFALFILLFASCIFIMRFSYAAPFEKDDFFLGGIQVNEPDHEAWIAGLKSNHFNTVSVTVYARQGDWDSDNLWYDREAPSVVAEIKLAKERGMKVVLIPRIALDHAFKRNQFLWHGMIMPQANSTLEVWFERYSSFVLKWAESAEKHGVDVFAVGSELNSLTSTTPLKELPELAAYYLNDEKWQQRKDEYMPFLEQLRNRQLSFKSPAYVTALDQYINAQWVASREWSRQVTFYGTQKRIEQVNARRERLGALWHDLINRVRKVYSGKITYAANFDQYGEVGFWNALDYMGINAYFPLRSRVAVDDLTTQLVAGWRLVYRDIHKVRDRFNLGDKRIIFTELGYTFRNNATIAPWDADGFSVVNDSDQRRLMIWKEQPVNFKERTLALRALRQVERQSPHRVLSGILYWKLSTIPEHRSIEPFVCLLSGDEDSGFRGELARFVG